MIAIIPARSGSKGLPGKNIKLLNGKPLIAYTIEAALKADNIEEVIISTNDVEIADIAIKYGAKCPFLRPAELATDNSLAIDTYLYTIKRLNNEFNYKISNITILLPTSPLRQSSDIDKAINLFKDNKADSVISFTEEDHPISWHKYINDNLLFEEIFEDKLQNRQDTRKSYHPNGSIYIFKYNLLKQNKYYSNNSMAYIMPRDRSVDIDNELDFRFAEFLLGVYK